MFRQVLYILFSLMENFEEFWRPIHGSEAVPTFGRTNHLQPEPVDVDLEGMIDRFKVGFKQFSGLWKDIFCPECFAEIEKAARRGPKSFYLPIEVWIQVLYELAATFHAWTLNRFKVIELVTPLYYGRVAAFVRQTKDMSSLEAEAVVEEQAEAFEKAKPYLLKVWDEKAGSQAA
jgi:hypothetical protein